MRKALVLATGATAVALTMSVFAQDFPGGRPVRFIAAGSAGTNTTQSVRTVAAKVQERTGWATFVEARPGGNFSVGINAALQSPADGLTVLQGFQSYTILPHTTKLDWDLFRDLVPVARYLEIPSMIVIGTSVPARNLQELVAWSKANPGKLSFGGTGLGTSSHLNAELLRMKFGLDLVYIPYKDSTIHTLDLFEGRVLAAYSPVSAFAEHVKAGKVRAVVATGSRRSEIFPDMPTTVELSGGDMSLDSDSWIGFFVRTGTPTNLVERLAREISAAADQKDVRDSLLKVGLTPLPVMEGPAAFKKKIDADYQKWGRVIKEAKLKFD